MKATDHLTETAEVQARAAANGMTIQQAAASYFVQSYAQKLNPACFAVLADKAAAIAAFDRIANIDGQATAENLSAAILA